MSRLLYIPGFQENKTGRPIGPHISEYCGNNSLDYHTIDVPGDTDANPDTDTEFSLSSLQEVIKNKIIKLLEGNDEELTVAAYSLSARPTIDAIDSLSQDYKKRINLKLIHPAINPLKTVQRMEFIRRRGKGRILSENKLLSGESDFFKELILNWKGNSIEFSKNLSKDFSDLCFDGLEDKLEKTLGVNSIKVFTSGNDMLTGEKESDGEKGTKILRSHFPSDDLISEFLSSLFSSHL